MRDFQLLCTFCNTLNYRDIIQKIKGYYYIPDRIFYIFENVKLADEIIMTYNVKLQPNNKKFPLTISIHRKKETNTLFTLNAMNEIIKEENNGVLDKNHKIDWNLYNNTLIITHETGYKLIELNLINTIKI